MDTGCLYTYTLKQLHAYISISTQIHTQTHPHRYFIFIHLFFIHIHLCVFEYLQRTEEGIGYPRAEVHGGCISVLSWKLYSGFLQEQQVLLGLEPSLQPHKYVNYCSHFQAYHIISIFDCSILKSVSWFLIINNKFENHSNPVQS